MPDLPARCMFCRRGPDGLFETVLGTWVCMDDQSCEVAFRAREGRSRRLLILAAIAVLAVAVLVVLL